MWKGHIASVCPSAKKKFTVNARQLHQKRFNRHPTKLVTTETERDSDTLPLHTIEGGGGATPPIKVPLLINDNLLSMELDTGATITIMSEKKFKEIFPRSKVEKSNVRLKTYTAESLYTSCVGGSS